MAAARRRSLRSSPLKAAETSLSPGATRRGLHPRRRHRQWHWLLEDGGRRERGALLHHPATVADSFSDQTRATARGTRSCSSSTYSLSYPISNGQVDNWDTMDKFWQQCIFNYLRCDPIFPADSEPTDSSTNWGVHRGDYV